MPVDSGVAAVAFVSILGATGMAVITLRHYEPPREGEDEGPEPSLEAAAFFILTGLLFVVFGYVIAFVGGVAQPYGRIATFLLTPLGFVSAYATYTGRISADVDRASALMGTVSGGVVGLYPIALDIASLL